MRIHGGATYKTTNMLDFSANINPLGIPDDVRKAVICSVSDCVRYPDPHCSELVDALAVYEQFPAAQIVCGNGAADLIDRIARAFRPRRALIPVPTFSEYAYALHAVGCEVRDYPLDPAYSFQLDSGFISALSDDVDIVFLCMPNNPTGQLIEPELLNEIADKCCKYGILLVCDECFLRFFRDALRYSLKQHFHKNCIILNAFTKLYGMPGLRLGYALCGDEQKADCLRKTGQYWSVSVPAQAAGIAALQLTDWVRKTVEYIAEERALLTDSLRDSGIVVYDGSANFLLIQAPSDFAFQMKRNGIIVRTCIDFHGLNDTFFRIAVRTHAENLALISAVRKVYQ